MPTRSMATTAVAGEPPGALMGAPPGAVAGAESVDFFRLVLFTCADGLGADAAPKQATGNRRSLQQPATSMEIIVSHNMPAALEELAKKQAGARVAAKAGLTAATSRLFTLSHSKLAGQVYNKPETTALRLSRTTGRVRQVQLWKRKGELLRQERADYTRLAELETRITNAAAYAAPREALQYPAKTPYKTRSGRSKRSPVIEKVRPDRTAHWRTEAAREGAAGVREEFAAAWAARLG